jgi:hypothetical protein
VQPQTFDGGREHMWAEPRGGVSVRSLGPDDAHLPTHTTMSDISLASPHLNNTDSSRAICRPTSRRAPPTYYGTGLTATTPDASMR